MSFNRRGHSQSPTSRKDQKCKPSQRCSSLGCLKCRKDQQKSFASGVLDLFNELAERGEVTELSLVTLIPCPYRFPVKENAIAESTIEMRRLMLNRVKKAGVKTCVG